LTAARGSFRDSFRAENALAAGQPFVYRLPAMLEQLVIIPTYDEKDNVRPISKAVLEFLPEAEILFVDDNSPDGTGRILDGMSAENPRIHVMHQAGKAGLGRAYIAGFRWALERPYRLIFEMDADFSHDPRELPNFVKAAEAADLVLGSRYVNGIRITNWPLSRLMLSKSAATYVRLITGMPVTDPTGGYKCYRREVLAAIDLGAIISNGYSFQVEMTHSAWMKGFRIREIPITFEDRRSGYSKMSKDILREAIWIVWKLAFRNGLRRRPPAAPRPPGR
jgi:dolichol-phosphate mannosyltransferase